jgi:hypothetical protein
MPRYAILEHDHPHLHWDLMLQAGDVLRTWRLAAPPAALSAVEAQPSFDHRLMYLDYEGPISGDRGRVVQWDGGWFEGHIEADGRVEVQMEGRRLRGVLRIGPGQGGGWQAIYSPADS